MEDAAAVTQERAIKIKSILVLVFLSLMWGSSFILIKRGLEVFEPIQVACLRILIAATAFIPILAWNFKKIDWSRWKLLVLVGLTGSGLPAFLFAFAQTKIDSSMAGVLNSLTPLFTLLLGIGLFGMRAGWLKVLGVFFGLGGALLLILLGDRGIQGSGGNPLYGLLVVLSTVCYATSVNLVGKYLHNMSSVLISATSFAFNGIPALFIIAFTDFTTVVQTNPKALEAIGYLSILSLGGTFIATMIFFQLVKWTGPLFSSMVAYLAPAVALMWGLFDGELITVLHVGGLLLILVGVFLSRRSG